MCPQFRSCFFVHFVVEKNSSSKNKYLVPFRAFSDRKRKITELLYKDEVYKIQGAIFEVYKEVGTGLEEELSLSNIRFEAQKEMIIHFKGKPLKQTYKPDLICYNKIIVEIKAVKAIAPEHQAQILNYLRATEMELGLLVNFGSHSKATIKRFIL